MGRWAVRLGWVRAWVYGCMLSTVKGRITYSSASWKGTESDWCVRKHWQTVPFQPKASQDKSVWIFNFFFFVGIWTGSLILCCVSASCHVPALPLIPEQKLCCWICCIVTLQLVSFAYLSWAIIHFIEPHLGLAGLLFWLKRHSGLGRRAKDLVCSAVAKPGGWGRHLSPEESVWFNWTHTSGSFMIVTFCIFFPSGRAKLIRNGLERQLFYRDWSMSARGGLSSWQPRS